MLKPIVVGLGLTLSLGIATAQPAPAPTPAPTPAPEKKKPATEERAGESLENGGDTRPWAAGVAPAKQQAALKKFRDGNVQLNSGFFADAAKLYREALVDWDHPAIHYNLALALLNLDQPIEVYDSLEKAIKFGPAPLEKDKFDHAKEYMLLVEKQIATVEVSCAKVGAKVSVDGKEVFTVKAGEVGRYKGRVRVGRHTFVAEKPGYNAQVDAPYVEPGQNFRIELTLYTAEELTRHKRRWNAAWMPYAVIGMGVVAGGVGGLMHLSATSSYDEYDTEVARCNEASGQMGCTESSVTDIRKSGDTKRTIGYVGYGVAGAAIVTGALLLYLNRQQSYEITADQYRAEQRKKGLLGVSPVVDPSAQGGMTGAVVFGQF
jgi:tetratricopeptide (TPR) repeat protein